MSNYIMETRTQVYESGEFCYVPLPKEKYKSLIGKRVLVELRALSKTRYEMEKDMFVEYMFKTKTFEGLDVLVLRRLYLNGAINESLAVPKSAFSKDEINEIEKLKKHPLQLIKEKNGRYYLGESGITASLGYVKGLLRAKDMELL